MKGMKFFKKQLWCSLVMGALIVGTMTGCGSKSESTSYAAAAMPEEESYSEAEVPPESEEQMTNTASGDAAADTSQVDGSYNQGSVPKINTNSDYNRKIIKNGELNLQTKQFNKTVEDVINEVQKLKGYVEESNVDGGNYYQEGQLRKAEMTVRVPAEFFDSFMNSSGKFGYVMNMNCNTQDVTSEYVDSKLRVEILQTRYDRLLELMKQTKDYDDIFRLEKQVAEVEYEIESYKGKLNHYDSLTGMSTVKVAIEEVEEIKDTPEVEDPTFVQSMGKAFKDSLDGVLTLLKGIVIILVYLCPLFIIIIPVLLIVWFVLRYLKRKENKAQGVEYAADKKDKEDKEDKEEK